MSISLAPEQAAEKLAEYSVEHTPSEGYLRVAARRIEASGAVWEGMEDDPPTDAPSDVLDALSLLAYHLESEKTSVGVTSDAVMQARRTYATPKRSRILDLIEDLLAPYGGSLFAQLA